MRITRVTTQLLRIPLPAPVGFSVKTLTAREHLIVRVLSDEGVEGIGFCLQDLSGRPAQAALDDLLSYHVLGQDPRDIHRLWDRMYTQTVRAGRRGNLIHALGAMDIALWDHLGKLTGQPLHKLLGGYRDEVPCYASGGYYYDDQDPMRSLEDELGTYIGMGFTAFKMKIGRLPPMKELERVRLAREILGPERLLMLDANQAFRNVTEVMSFVRKVEGYDIHWLEEPLSADMVEGMARLRSVCPIPLATGEVEATRWAFSELLQRRAVDVIQPDATACGGITEWMRIVALADIYGVPVAPHYHWDLHVQLGCAFPEVTILEKFVGTAVKNFDLVLSEPLQVTKGGGLRPPDGAGHGMRLDADALHRYLVHETVTEA